MRTADPSESKQCHLHGNLLSRTAAIIAAVAVVAALLAALIIGANARRNPKTTSKDPNADPDGDNHGDEDEEEEEDEQSTITLALTHPAGQSPNVFTSGWVFGARAISDPGGPNEKDISDRVMWSGSGTFRPNNGNRSRPVFAGSGTNQIILTAEADGKVVNRSFIISAVSPAGFAHVGSSAFCPTDSHGCPACPHLDVVGTVQTGSTVVTVDGQPAARVGDGGTHVSCCGPNTFTIASGDSSVLIEGRPAARLGSATTHCGGTGHLTA